MYRLQLEGENNQQTNNTLAVASACRTHKCPSTMKYIPFDCVFSHIVVNYSHRTTVAGYCHVSSLLIIFTLKMETIHYSETSVLNKSHMTAYLRRWHSSYFDIMFIFLLHIDLSDSGIILCNIHNFMSQQNIQKNFRFWFNVTFNWILILNEVAHFTI
jgi:hypothetical protein